MTSTRTRPSCLLTAISTLLFAGENLHAFEIKLVRTCARRSPSARTSVGGLGRNDLQPHLMLRGETLVRSYGALDQFRQIEHLQLKRHLARLDFLHVQNIVDHADQPLAIVFGNIDEAADLVAQGTGHTASQNPERAADRGERRAQLVTHRRNEFAFHPVEAFELGDIGQQRIETLDFTEHTAPRDVGHVELDCSAVACCLPALKLNSLARQGAPRIGLQNSVDLLPVELPQRPPDQFIRLRAYECRQSLCCRTGGSGWRRYS